jgi:hypothetical protein
MNALRFAAVLLTALALVPGGAHLLELPHKIGLSRDDYFVVQAIYRGWALLGIVWIGAILANLLLAAALRRRGEPAGLPFGAGLLLLIGLAIFFGWTFPANQATADWTLAPADWASLRSAWEWSHAVNAVLTLAALCLATAGAVAGRR